MDKTDSTTINKNIILCDNIEEDWDYFFPNLSPVELYLLTTKNLPNSTKLKINARGQIPSLIFSNKEKNNSFEFKYAVIDNYVDYRSGNVCESLQQNDVSKTMQMNIFNFCKQSNLSRIDVSAIDIGAYAWARMGFVPETILWPKVKDTLRARFNSLKQKLPIDRRSKIAHYFNAVSKVIKSTDPKSIWIIADEKEPFYFDQKISWGQAMLLPNYSLPPNLDISMNTNTAYLGRLNLNDKDCVNRIESYVYGKKQTKTKTKSPQISN